MLTRRCLLGGLVPFQLFSPNRWASPAYPRHGLALRSPLAKQVGTALGALAAGQAPRRPNVLFIPVDDLNDWVEGFGANSQSVTPNISRIARAGVRFQRAYCNAPMCNPSRASLLAGLRPTTTGIYENDDTWRDGASGVVTLPEYFMNHGYQVAGAGKVFHAKQTDFSCFHHYLRNGDFDQIDNEAPPKGPDKKIRKAFGWQALDVGDEKTPDYHVARYTAEFLKQKHDRPFFMACGFVKPHLPWNVPRKYFDKFPVEKIELPPYLPNDLDDVPKSATSPNRMANFRAIRDAGKWKEAVAAYLACINYTDTNVGRVLDALETSPHARNTVVVLWGDHGWHLGEKDHWQKFTLWERVCRAPLVMSAPGMARGADCERLVEFLDIYPTLVEMCGLPANPKLEGRSFAKLLRDPAAPWSGAGITSHGPDKISVRTERWRYSRFPDGEELYDHQSDPHEWYNLASKAELASVREQHRNLLPAKVNRARLRSWQGLPEAEQRKLQGRARA